jgi:hypothetical protein
VEAVQGQGWSALVAWMRQARRLASAAFPACGDAVVTRAGRLIALEVPGSSDTLGLDGDEDGWVQRKFPYRHVRHPFLERRANAFFPFGFCAILTIELFIRICKREKQWSPTMPRGI